MKYIILILLSATAFSKEPKYSFGQNIEFITGFYKGCKGTIIGLDNQSDPYVGYEVEIRCAYKDSCGVPNKYNDSKYLTETDLSLWARRSK